MAKSMTAGKRENEKKRLAKREAKLKRKEGRKSTKSSFDDMIAYVDEYGMITSTPPEENIKKQEINVEEIMISTPRKEDEEPVILRGRIEFFNEARGFGFIKDLAGIEKYFFHVNNVVGNITENNTISGSDNQFFIYFSIPTAFRNVLIGPNVGLKNNENIKPITVAEITTGTKYDV